MIDDVVFLELTTYQGLSIGAIHWYGKLKPWKGEEIELRYTLTALQAKRLDEWDFVWHEGDETGRWDSRDKLIQYAIDVYKSHFPGAKVLIRGQRSTAQAQPILDGLEEYADKLNELYQECESHGFWDIRENWKKVEPINDEWTRMFNEAVGREVYRLF